MHSRRIAVERAIAGLWAMRYRTVAIWLGGVHPPEPKVDVGKHAIFAILVPLIALKRPFALPCARLQP